jgi:hypothetical protein
MDLVNTFLKPGGILNLFSCVATWTESIVILMEVAPDAEEFVSFGHWFAIHFLSFSIR